MGGRIAVAVAMLAVLAITSCRSGGGGGDDVKLPPLTPFNEALASRLTDVARTAADVRGLAVNDKIEQGTLTRDQLTAYYQQSAEKISSNDAERLQATNTAFRMLGMIGQDDDLLKIVTSYYGSDTLGFYSSSDQKMVLVADAPTDLSLDDEVVLAHEYVHSFQDARFDLSKLHKLSQNEDKERANTQYNSTIDALTEGDATIASGLYVLKKYGQAGIDQLKNEPKSPKKQPPAPPAFERYFSFPYEHGADFVGYLYRHGGWPAVDRAYANPPQTEEQILHPEKYLAGETAATIKSANYSKQLGRGWKEEEDGVFGEFDVYNWILTSLDDESLATLASSGWGGGRVRVYSNKDQTGHVVLEISLIWDDKNEAREFYTTFAELVRRIDPTPDVLDPSAQIVGWQSDQQAGEAWIQGESFAMVVATHPEDVAPALRLFQAPDHISSSDNILQ